MPGTVEVPHADEFKPVRICGLPDTPPGSLPSFRLAGFDWCIYHRTVKQGTRPAGPSTLLAKPPQVADL